MRRLLAYLRPHAWYVVGALVALVGDAVTQLAPPYWSRSQSIDTSRRGISQA